MITIELTDLFISYLNDIGPFIVDNWDDTREGDIDSLKYALDAFKTKNAEKLSEIIYDGMFPRHRFESKDNIMVITDNGKEFLKIDLSRF